MQLPDPRIQPTMTVDEVATILGLSRGSAYNAAKAGELPTIRMGRRLLVPTAKLAQLLGPDPAQSHDEATDRR